MLKRSFKLIGKSVASAEDFYLVTALTMMGLIIVLDILTRMITGSSIFGAQEVVKYLGIGVIAIGGASCSRVDFHIKVDIIYRLLHGRNLSLSKIIGEAFSLFIVCIWFSWLIPFVSFAFRIGEGSPLLHMPMFIIKGLLLGGAALMIVYHALHLIRGVKNYVTDKTYSEGRQTKD